MTENGFVYEINDGGALITGYTGEEKTIIIPNILGGVPVRVLDVESFAASTVKKITLPSSLREIRDRAFYACTELEELELNEGLEVIGEEFAQFTSLKNLVLPSTVADIKKPRSITFGITTFGENKNYYGDGFGFYTKRDDGFELIQTSHDKSVREYSVCDNTVSIKVYAFENSALDIIRLPASIKILPDGVFTFSRDDERDVKEISVEKGGDFYVKDGFLLEKKERGIKLCKFFGTEKNIIIPDGVDEIGEKALGRKKLKMISVPSSLKDFDSNVFSGGTVIKLKFSNGVIISFPADNTMVTSELFRMIGESNGGVEKYDEYLLEGFFDADMARMIFTRLTYESGTLSEDFKNKLKKRIIDNITQLIENVIRLSNAETFKDLLDSGILTSENSDYLLETISSYDKKYSAITGEMKKMLLEYSQRFTEYDYTL